MEKQSFTITIKAPRQKVWDTMLDPSSYQEWTWVFSPGSRFEGEWVQGTSISFTDASGGGMKAVLDVVQPGEQVFARHVAVLGPGGVEDTESEGARAWIGATEQYLFKDIDGGTELTIHMQIHRDYAEMMADGWPRALEELRRLCERE